MTFALTWCANIFVGCSVTPTFFRPITSFSDSFHYTKNKKNLYVGSFKTESARGSSNKWTKTLYQDYLHFIANFCRALLIIFSKQFISSNTKRRKRMLNFVWNTWWNETDDEILPVFPQNHWTLKFIFSRSRGKLFFGVISGNYLCT